MVNNSPVVFLVIWVFIVDFLKLILVLVGMGTTFYLNSNHTVSKLMDESVTCFNRSSLERQRRIQVTLSSRLCPSQACRGLVDIGFHLLSI